MNNPVYALAVIGTDLYAGGSFTTAGGVSTNYIARWDGTSWSALGSGMNSEVSALAVTGTDLYAGGEFTIAGSIAANRIAKWNGTIWSALGTGIGSDYVQVLVVIGTDLYAGGYFTTAGGDSANNIAMWNGTSWTTLGSGMNNNVYAFAVMGADLSVGGGFTSAGGKPSAYVGQWHIPGVVGVTETKPTIPAGYALSQNYPNPFNPATTIRYYIPERSLVILKIFDMSGQQVAALVDKEQPAGSYTIKWQAGGFPSGVYFYRLQTNNFIETKKLILLK
jgi:hypothetical protein